MVNSPLVKLIRDSTDARRVAYTAWLHWLETGNKKAKQIAEGWMKYADIQEEVEDKQIATIWQQKLVAAK